MTSAQTPTAQLHMRIHGMRKSVQNIIYASKVPEKQALNFDLEGALQFSFGKGHFYEKSVNLYLNFAKGTTERAQGTTAIAVCDASYSRTRP